MTDELNIIEKVANGFQNELRRGFLSILVLHALKISPNNEKFHKKMAKILEKLKGFKFSLLFPLSSY